MKRTVAIVLGAAALVVFVVVFFSGIMAWKAWRVSKPMITIGRMRDLMSVLIAEHPSPLNKQTVMQTLMKYDRAKCYTDGWGHPFLIEPIGSGAGQVVYRITSLGSDGKKGSCCWRFVGSFEEDAVLQGDVWLQQWSFGHSPVDSKADGG